MLKRVLFIRIPLVKDDSFKKVLPFPSMSECWLFPCLRKQRNSLKKKLPWKKLKNSNFPFPARRGLILGIFRSEIIFLPLRFRQILSPFSATTEKCPCGHRRQSGYLLPRIDGANRALVTLPSFPPSLGVRRSRINASMESRSERTDNSNSAAAIQREEWSGVYLGHFRFHFFSRKK